MREENVIRTKNLAMHFGGIKAIDDLSFAVKKGEILGIIGPNGAGKTTVFNVLSGIYVPTGGEIRYKDTLLNNVKAHEITVMGIARTFQNIRLFRHQSVLDNLKVAQYGRIRYGVFSVIFSSGSMRREEETLTEKCMQILDFMGLRALAGTNAGSLSYGVQRRVEIARALASEPEVLLLDEPAAGMNPGEIDELNELILKIRDHYNLTIMLVEHQMRLVMGICNEILVMSFGKRMALGPPAEIRTNQQVLEAYLGKAKGFEDGE